MDHYFDPDGRMVFTGLYHANRGSCCNQGCRHCPFGNSPSESRLEDVITYHQRTKHHVYRYAAGPGMLDWETQPDPFRRYEGASQIPLNRKPLISTRSYNDIWNIQDQGSFVPLDREGLSMFFLQSLAISAWKESQGARWALRVNPSSGNLHPTECYLIAGPITGISSEPAVFHYGPKDHVLEKRTTLSETSWKNLENILPKGAVLLILSSIHWREGWKYGERAFRYCQLDAGHAIGSLGIAARGLGWNLRLLDSIASEDLFLMSGLSVLQDLEAEEPECLLVLSPSSATGLGDNLSLGTVATFRDSNWVGQPNQLSGGHESWPIIDLVTLATRKKNTEANLEFEEHPLTTPIANVGGSPLRTVPVSHLIQQRRSAVSFDGKTAISYVAFLESLRCVQSSVLQQTLRWNPVVHLAIFVHRVDGLVPGLYCLVRDPTKLNDLKGAMSSEFRWEIPADCPADLGFYQLSEGNYQNLAKGISCQQDIAANGSFSLGMIAEFELSLRRQGPWFYRRLFWECGALGQLLYLTAEAWGVRATGIGCFFDDLMHDLLGLGDNRYQSLYHLTVGKPVVDERLTTLPGYGGDSL